ncbi:MAG: hypothetical protein JO038_09845 [Alphaproteobacteria bacterium]|nr:hypothetical protein [Alphaproteobacteria bacterium]
MLLLSTAACGVVDQFSDRAVDFNIEAEQAQLQAILLNIIRASYNRPMQFTTVSTVTGTASVSGGTSLSIPFGHHRPPLQSSPDVLGITDSISGGPTFTVPVLDTQEFYQGELKPVTGQEYRFFLDEGITPSVLFYTLIDRIELTVAGSKPPTIFTFHDYVGDDLDLDVFQAVGDYLLSMGLTIERVEHTQQIGGAMNAAQLGGLRDLAAATTAGLRVVPVQAATPAGKAQHTPRTPTQYRAEKVEPIYRPCFDAMVPKPDVTMDADLLCGSSATTDNPAQTEGNLARTGGFVAPRLAAWLAEIRNAFIRRLRENHDDAAADELQRVPQLPGNQKLQLKLYTRSTESILYHFGSVVARSRAQGRVTSQSFTVGIGPRVIQVKIGEPYLPYPLTSCQAPMRSAGYRCENLFVLDAASGTSDGPKPKAAISVSYEGTEYGVPADQERAGRTMRLLDLVKQLLALHTSAKELPASNVLNVIGSAP